MPSQPFHRRLLDDKICGYRKQVSLSQEKLAEKADLHHNFIGEVERGNMKTSLTSMLKIAKVLKLRELVDDL